MHINGYYPVDVASIVNQYAYEGLSLELLRRCNAMTFKLIDGVGEGYFLLTNDQADAIITETATLTITATQDGSTKVVTVYVLNKIKLHHPNQTDTHLVVLHVAEEKYKLLKRTVSRNYNLIDRQSITAVDPIPFKSPDDSLQATLATILLTESGMSVSGTATTETPYECIIQGLDVVSAIDKLCKCYGMLWTVDGGALAVYSVTSAGIPNYDRINDIRKTTLTQRMSNITMIFPVVANGEQRNSFKSEELAYSGQGEAIVVYNPFLPAVYTSAEVDINYADRVAYLGTAQPYFEGIMDIQGTYIAFHYHNPFTGATSPFYFSITLADYGAGPRTICKADIKYPFLKPPDDYKFDPTPGTSTSTVPEPVYAVFELTADLPSGIDNISAGATVIATNDSSSPATITAVNNSNTKAYTGARGIALKMRVSSGPDVFEWRIIEVDQPAMRVLATLATNPATPGGVPAFGADPRATTIFTTSTNPTLLTEYPFGFRHSSIDSTASPTWEFDNPYELFGETGDQVILEWDASQDKYVLMTVLRQRQDLLWATLTGADRGTGTGATMSCNPTDPASSGTMPATPFDIVDTYNVAFNAKIGDKLLAQWDARAQQYKAIVSQHTTTKVKGTVTADFLTSATSFTVTVTTSYNGDSAGTTVTVENIYNWSGTAGMVVTAEYNAINDTWEPVQMECA